MASLKLAPALGSYGPRVEEVVAVERRKALPCASISRRSGKQAAVVTLQGAPFGVPPPSLLIESEVP
jgi:hypothetical protein